MQSFTGLGANSLLTHFTFKIIWGDYPAIEEFPAHTRANARPQNWVLSQG
jgi:hypothetical protein